MPMQITNRFLNRMFVAFLAWVNPDSRLAKPRCMMNTSAVASIIQRLLTVAALVAVSTSKFAVVVISSIVIYPSCVGVCSSLKQYLENSQMRHVFAISGVGCMVPEQRACRYCTGALHDKSPAQFTCRAFLALFYHFEEMLIYRVSSPLFKIMLLSAATAGAFISRTLTVFTDTVLWAVWAITFHGSILLL